MSQFQRKWGDEMDQRGINRCKSVVIWHKTHSFHEYFHRFFDRHARWQQWAQSTRLRCERFVAKICRTPRLQAWLAACDWFLEALHVQVFTYTFNFPGIKEMFYSCLIAIPNPQEHTETAISSTTKCADLPLTTAREQCLSRALPSSSGPRLNKLR